MVTTLKIGIGVASLIGTVALIVLGQGIPALGVGLVALLLLVRGGEDAIARRGPQNREFATRVRCEVFVALGFAAALLVFGAVDVLTATSIGDALGGWQLWRARHAIASRRDGRHGIHGLKPPRASRKPRGAGSLRCC